MPTPTQAIGSRPAASPGPAPPLLSVCAEERRSHRAGARAAASRAAASSASAVASPSCLSPSRLGVGSLDDRRSLAQRTSTDIELQTHKIRMLAALRYTNRTTDSEDASARSPARIADESMGRQSSGGSGVGDDDDDDSGCESDDGDLVMFTIRQPGAAHALDGIEMRGLRSETL